MSWQFSLFRQADLAFFLIQRLIAAIGTRSSSSYTPMWSDRFMSSFFGYQTGLTRGDKVGMAPASRRNADLKLSRRVRFTTSEKSTNY